MGRSALMDWAGVPRGPLGWISTHTVLSTGDAAFRQVAAACQLRPDDALLDVACGSGLFLAEQVERAGFSAVTFTYVDWAGNNPVGKLFARVAGPLGGDLRLACGIKP